VRPSDCPDALPSQKPRLRRGGKGLEKRKNCVSCYGAGRFCECPMTLPPTVPIPDTPDRQANKEGHPKVAWRSRLMGRGHEATRFRRRQQ
jgi:hypothetical protein